METRAQHQTDCLRIVLYGPESTGKTTLAKALAAQYQTTWVPEFARDFLQKKWDEQQEHCTLEDLTLIAEGQLAAENKALQAANQFLFCDTNVLVTKVWSETHFEGYCAPELLRLLETTHYDLYLLTDIDIPWEKDDLRDRPEQRDSMRAYFKEQLNQYNFPYIEVRGTHEQRLTTALNGIEKMRKKKGILSRKKRKL